MKKKLLSTGLLILILISIALAGCGEKPRTVAPVEGAQAPDISATTLEGEKIALKDLRGKPLLLTFWRTDSPPGVREMLTLNRFKEEKGDDLEVLTINVSEDKNQVDIFLKEKKLALTVIPDDSKNTIAKLYRIDYIPTTFVIDKKGIILKKINGGLDKSVLDNIFK